MPHNHEWQSRIKAIEREYTATRQATERFEDAVRQDPTILRGDLRPRDIAHASVNLEGTYIVRLFAEFESGLRSYWQAAVRETRPTTEQLLDALADRRRIPAEQRARAHEVRDYRNSLVHEREEVVDGIGIAVARGCLCHYFSFLPPRW